MLEDPERCYAAVASRDARFDGWFVMGVTSTGIYCRPSCPARTPRRRNVRFFPSAAAAQGAGFRSCKRCRPDATPGSPAWDARADVAARAVRLIAEGTVEREGVAGLAARLGYSARQLQRVLQAELGAGALALARAQRAETARLLCETTALPLSEVAFTAGFGSVRQFNDTLRAVYAASPSELRTTARRRRGGAVSAPRAEDGARPLTLSLRLAHRRPFAADAALVFLAARAVPGVERASTDPAGRITTFARALDLPHGPGSVELTPADGHLQATLRLTDGRDLSAAVARCRRALDLDADPVAVDAHLARDPRLTPLVAARPGTRVPGCGDGFEALVRAVLGQQVSVAGALTATRRLSEELGGALPPGHPGLERTFPRPEAVAALDPDALAMPRPRARALVGAAAAVASGEIDLGAGTDRAEARARLLALRGIGPWTADYVALRGLGDPDAFPPTDLGVVRRAGALDERLTATPTALVEHAERWRPWRAYATIHLWSTPA